MGNKSDCSENAKIGHMLMTARKSRGVSQEEIATATGMTANHISSIERSVCKAGYKMKNHKIDLTFIMRNMIKNP